MNKDELARKLTRNIDPVKQVEDGRDQIIQDFSRGKKITLSYIRQ
jgi:hypothetical protein